MTSNQIAYFNAREQQRSDLAREAETARANRKQERISMRQLRETTRSNKANEAIGRRNAVSNRITARSNRANARTNAKNARINLMNARTNQKEARTNLFNARTNRLTSDRNYTVANRRLKQDFYVGQLERGFKASQNYLDRTFKSNQNYLQRTHETELAKLSSSLRSTENQEKIAAELESWLKKIDREYTQQEIIQLLKNEGLYKSSVIGALGKLASAGLFA